MSDNLDLEQKQDTAQEADQPKVTILTIIGSLFASWFGVQTNKNRERDFTYGKASTFIYAGIIFLVMFVVFVIVLVKIVLHLATT